MKGSGRDEARDDRVNEYLPGVSFCIPYSTQGTAAIPFLQTAMFSEYKDSHKVYVRNAS